ncbi:OvmZ protein [Streptomyces sp. MUM 136J]|nr:OvmZ protein [Streptomyces sp. MUM 136J]
MHGHRLLGDEHGSRDCARLCGRICAKCVARIDGELRTLLDLYEESDLALAPAPPQLRERVSGSRGAAGIVLDERAVALRSRLSEVLGLWARLVVDERDEAGHRPVERGVGALVPFLRRQLPWLAGHPAGVDFDEELVELRSELGALFGPGPVRRFPLGACVEPDCAGNLHGVLPADGDRVPSHVSCDAGHALPPRRWLLLADRARRDAA